VALLFAAFAVKLAANQVVVGVVINLLAVGLTGTLYRAVFGETGSFISIPTLPQWEVGRLVQRMANGHLSPEVVALLEALLRHNALAYLAFGIVPLSLWWLNGTRGGLELRAVGEQPVAAEASGINVIRLRTCALLYGGLMAGIAGACLSVGDVGTFKEEMTAGRGFIALAIVTSGRWHPVGCLLAALVFGFAQALQFQLQASGFHVSAQLFLALPYVATLVILTTGGRLSQAPAALGRPYRKA
jgi:general nucleoside transport system permease protein